jgi:protein SCO1/2
MLALLLAAITLAPIGFAPASVAKADGPKQPSYLDGAGIDQKLGSQVPLDLVFHDEHGKDVKLGDFFDGVKKPVILSLVYYKCPNIQLCTLELNDLNRGMNGISTSLKAGDDYQVLTISFDPKEGADLALDKKETYMQSYRQPHAEEGWRFLTGDEDSIKKLTSAVGFRYKYDPKFQQYIHPSGLILLTPKGVVSRYFFGIDYDLKDLRLSLDEASNNKIGTLTDKILLYCFHYDPTTSKYSLAVVHLMQVGGILTMGALGAFWFAMYRREHP